LVSYTVRGAYQVSIYGEIKNSGSFRYHDGMTLLDLLIEGGTLSDKADLSNVRIVRGDLIILRDVTDLVYGKSLIPNMPLQSGDYVIIPQQQAQSKIKVLVLGKVARVGSVYLPEGSSVLDALAAANGPEGRAGLGKAYIIRLVDDLPTAVPVDIKSLINRLDLAQNRTLIDGDVFFIPESGGVDLNNLMSNLSFFNLIKSTKDNFTNAGK
jgi:protein involved in polysaccharide export with SLBB domain